MYKHKTYEVKEVINEYKTIEELLAFSEDLFVRDQLICGEGCMGCVILSCYDYEYNLEVLAHVPITDKQDERQKELYSHLETSDEYSIDEDEADANWQHYLRECVIVNKEQLRML